ncbi:hypothetical protein QT384_10265 [Arcobacter cryaerophilus gv. pseudocryaerophilus]|uniref:Mobilization protein n=3 Tax=Arcobacteraceae TaxID=2808963 RepID=A0AA96DWD0_9BACT|nr:hypothetical protein RMP68_02370 [Arcobacter sp. AZ-2023]WNL36056.1 hypothetical protein RMQ66_10265 [Arcobacter sp. AZ-2023]WPD11772.1 hypothetical protein QT384_10265 [Arcobacter sp. DSM 115960]
MANANAVIIRKPKIYKIPTSSNLAHNSGVTQATYWLHDGKDITQSIKLKDMGEINNIWKKWEEEAKSRYKNNPLNKRALKSNAVIVEEGLIIIGSHVQATKNEIVKILNDFVRKFQKDNNTKILHIAYHNHEGHEDTNRNEVINRHAHFLFSNVNNNGVMVRRNWKRYYLKQLQDDIYEISKKYIPTIERGKEVIHKEVYIDGKLVKINERKHQHHRLFREKQKQEEIRNQLIKEQSSKEKELIEKINRLQKQNDDLILKNKLDQIKINEITSAINEKNYKHSDNIKQIEEQKYILDKLTAFRNRQAIENNMQFDLIKFISYAENELMNSRNLKQEKEQLESKNEQLNHQIAKIKIELNKLKNQNNSNNIENIVNDENNYVYEDNNYSKSLDEDYSKNPNSYK